MNFASVSKTLLLTSALLALAACGGGGGGTGSTGGTTNSAPIASAPNQTVDEQTTVTLDGSASSDPDGNALSYSWSQTGGVSVTLSNATTAQATFDSPDVGIGSNTTLSFQLRVGDGTGAFGTANVDVTVNGVSNTDPVVNAGADQATTEQATVNLAGSASDNDIGDTLSYTWTQTVGTNVTIINADQAQASFEAPSVGPAGETLTFQLAVNDGTATVTDTLEVAVTEAAAAVDISGKLQYEFVPPNINCNGLNFLLTETRPIRAATVQLIDDATGNVLASTVATDAGDYAFSNVAGNTDVRIRVRAELKRAGAPSWDVEVRDNVDTSASPPPLGSRPLYVYEETFNSGGADLVRDVTATTGWDGVAYTGTRAAAPFAILDAIYSGMQLVLTADATANFGPLDAFWSVNNTLTSPSDIDAGELSSSFYSGSIDSLFLLGDANTDTEEFDDHVSVHEWGHYFEDVFSRSDSIGGPHAIGESVDARLAFGEGWATALAAMALDEPLYCDTGPAGSTSGFGINTETNNSGPQGWYNEMSVATLIYDLYDTNADGSDGGSIGFAPIFQTMTGPQRNTNAFTSLFSFATELRALLTDPADQALLDSQLIRENIEIAGLDIWGSTQGSIAVSPNQSRDVLPLYTTMPLDGSTINICTNSDYDNRRDGNNLAEYRYLRFTTTTAQRYTVTMTSTTPTPVTPDTDDRDQSDPDIYIFRRGQVVAAGTSGDENTEVFDTQTLPADTYVADPREFRFEDEDGAPADYPEQICFDISMTPF